MSINFPTNQGSCLFPFQKGNRGKKEHFFLFPSPFSISDPPPKCSWTGGVLTGRAGWYVFPQFVITILSYMEYVFKAFF